MIPGGESKRSPAQKKFMRDTILANRVALRDEATYARKKAAFDERHGATVARIQGMIAQGRYNVDIAAVLGKSTTSLDFLKRQARWYGYDIPELPRGRRKQKSDAVDDSAPLVS